MNLAKYLTFASLLAIPALLPAQQANSDYWKNWSPSGSGEIGDFQILVGGGLNAPFDAKAAGRSVEFDTGPAATIAFNYFFKDVDHLYAGLDFTYFQTEVKSVGGMSLGSVLPGASNEINSYNGFATIGLAFDVGDRFHFMVGGGVGAGIIDLSYSPPPGGGSDVNESETLLMYKLELLAEIDVTNAIAIGFGYKYVAAGGDIDTNRIVYGQQVNKIKDVATNVFTVSLSYRF